MGRPHTFDRNPELMDDFAAMLADGSSRQAMAEAFGVDVDTITKWRKLPGVQEKVTKLVRERANRILTHTDTKIEKMLESGKDIPMRDLLAIRQAFAVDGDSGDSVPRDLEELLAQLHENPEMAEALQGALATLSADGADA